MTMTEYSAPPSKGDWKPVEPVRSSFARTTVYALGWMYDWVNRVAWIVAALSVPFYLYVAFYTIPAAQRFAQQQAQEAIESEDIAFCGKHGMPVGTREYALCAADLMDIRAKQDQRTAEDMQRTF